MSKGVVLTWLVLGCRASAPAEPRVLLLCCSYGCEPKCTPDSVVAR